MKSNFAKLCAAIAVAAGLSAGRAAAETFFLEAEAFADRGGWVSDTQFMDQMGSPYLLAHGMGVKVADAETVFEAGERDAGVYSVWARTANWVKNVYVRQGKTPPLVTPGLFEIRVNGEALPVRIGSQGDGNWLWVKAGEVKIKAGINSVKLCDLDGFDGRCDAVVLTDEKDPERILDGPRRPSRAVAEGPKPVYDVVVAGGGIAGICAAVSAARLGLETALIHDRPVLGGNNSSEVRVHLGAWQNMPPYPRLGDIVAEIAPAKGGNAQPAAVYEDERKMAVVKAQKNLTLLINRRVNGVITNREGRIVSVFAQDTRFGDRLEVEGRWFVDCTGDGTVGYLAGADWRMGREAKSEYGEPWAPEKPDTLTMGASVQWYAGDSAGDGAFPTCGWMIPFDEKNASRGLRGDWWWEAGIGRDQIADAEYIRDYGLLVAYSNWAFLKNVSSKKDSYAGKELKWVAYNAGRRESRRLMGDFILTEKDILGKNFQNDGTCATTWTIDLHLPKSKKDTRFEGEPFQSDSFNKVIWPYPVPYRCLYSRNVPNLFMAGRDISVSHVALGTTRLMRTHGMMGEVVGMAASICKKHGCDPRAVYTDHLDELKALMKKGVGDGGVHPPQMYNLQTSLDPRFVDRKAGNFQKRIAPGAILVDDALPAGNIVVEGIKDGIVRLRPDLRGSRPWFYWAFRVRGAAGRTLRFIFTDKDPGGPVGVRGPVVSTDAGASFSYPLDGKSSPDGFVYTFGLNEIDVRFYECHPYVRGDWDNFTGKHKKYLGRRMRLETLCRSRSGAEVPAARFGCVGEGMTPKYRFFMCARNHASETMASWVLEGAAEAFLADDELGAWLAGNVELMVVPFVDYDGVQAGDQGKNRVPHDHNRDYTSFIYPETKALTEWVLPHAGGGLYAFIDLHCPWIRGKYNEFVYSPLKSFGTKASEELDSRFAKILETVQTGGLRYKASNDLPYGKGWNTGSNYRQGLSCTQWAQKTLDGLKICRTFEIPFANADGVTVTPEKCRAFGRDIVRALYETITQSDH